jgi:hypothetical protein
MSVACDEHGGSTDQIPSKGKSVTTMNGETSSPAADRQHPDDEASAAAEARAEVEAVLLAEEGGLGDVWRRTQAGESPDQIRIARGAERPNFVWSYNRIAKALLDGDLPRAPSVAVQSARTFRRIEGEPVQWPWPSSAG